MSDFIAQQPIRGAVGSAVSDTASAVPVLSLRWQVGLETDIGGGRENQDDCFVWIKRDDHLIVLCVLDGHGREVGKIASESAKTCLFKYLDETYAELMANPKAFLIEAHRIAHENIRNSFKTELEQQGYEVIVAPEGYLMKRRKSVHDFWSCVHGGTSCSIVALVKDKLYIANVGDSTGILCSSYPIFDPSQLQYLGDAAVPDEVNRKNSVTSGEAKQLHTVSQHSMQNKSAASDGTHNSDLANERTDLSSSGYRNGSNVLILTAEHSPECPYEYQRLRRFRSRDGNPSIPALVVVYDSSSHDKTRCSAVFEKDANGNLVVTNKGSYYKNVRKEWASLVSTPPYAQFQDALAFTRSLGDLHLHSYGVTHWPEIQMLDLNTIFTKLSEMSSENSTIDISSSPPKNSDPASTVAKTTLCLVLATDGIWDNWLYEDVNKFVMDSSCLDAVGSAADGAKRVTISFMQRNALYAKRNFGSNADNATGIVLYLSVDENFPSL